MWLENRNLILQSSKSGVEVRTWRMWLEHWVISWKLWVQVRLTHESLSRLSDVFFEATFWCTELDCASVLGSLMLSTAQNLGPSSWNLGLLSVDRSTIWIVKLWVGSWQPILRVYFGFDASDDSSGKFVEWYVTSLKVHLGFDAWDGLNDKFDEGQVTCDTFEYTSGIRSLRRPLKIVSETRFYDLWMALRLLSQFLRTNLRYHLVQSSESILESIFIEACDAIYCFLSWHLCCRDSPRPPTSSWAMEAWTRGLLGGYASLSILQYVALFVIVLIQMLQWMCT